MLGNRLHQLHSDASLKQQPNTRDLMGGRVDADEIRSGKVGSQGLHVVSCFFPNVYLCKIHEAECLNVLHSEVVKRVKTKIN